MRVEKRFCLYLVVLLFIKSHRCFPIPAREVTRTCEACHQFSNEEDIHKVGLSFADSESRVEESRWGLEYQADRKGGSDDGPSVRGPHVKVTADFDTRKAHYGATLSQFKIGDNKEYLNIKNYAAGVELGYGAMGRVSFVNTDIKTGHVGSSVGINVDTGAIFDGKNVEVKLLGIGAKVGVSEVQFCVFLCMGFNW